MKIAVSFSTGRLAPKHDFRKGMIPENVERERIKDNVILIDNLKGKTIEDFTNEEMKPYIDEYNKKQKRSDRKINTSYTEWHLNNKILTQNAKTKEDVKLAYETVICYGNNKDLWKEYFETEDKKRQNELYEEAVNYYKKAVNEFIRKYPHLKVLYAVIHADEAGGSIHCHLCFQPRAEYTKGLACKVCIGRALEQDGFERSEKRSAEEGFQLTRLYKDFRHNVLNKELEKLGYEIKEEEHGKKHEETNRFKEITRELDKEIEEKNIIIKEQTKKAENLLSFNKELERNDEIELRPEYNPQKVKCVEKGIGKNKTKIYQMEEETFDALRSGHSTEYLNKIVDEKIKKQEKAYQNYLKNMETSREKQLEEEITKLKEEIREKDIKIRSQDIEIRKIQEKLNYLRIKIETILDFTKKVSYKLYESIKEIINGKNEDPIYERSR